MPRMWGSCCYDGRPLRRLQEPGCWGSATGSLGCWVRLLQEPAVGVGDGLADVQATKEANLAAARQSAVKRCDYDGRPLRRLQEPAGWGLVMA